VDRGCRRSRRPVGESRGSRLWRRRRRRDLRRSLGVRRRMAFRRSRLSFGHARSWGCRLGRPRGFRRPLSLQSGRNIGCGTLRHRSNPQIETATPPAGSKREMAALSRGCRRMIWKRMRRRTKALRPVAGKDSASNAGWRPSRFDCSRRDCGSLGVRSALASLCPASRCCGRPGRKRTVCMALPAVRRHCAPAD
jgi:hypothetical protein